MSEQEPINEQGTAWRIYRNPDGSLWIELKSGTKRIGTHCPYTLAKKVKDLLNDEYEADARQVGPNTWEIK